ncbi:MAG: hypothetical protein U5K75_02195 [Ahrensia sp.]|nr:hypothetical protein [Ahrensia sp.]
MTGLASYSASFSTGKGTDKKRWFCSEIIAAALDLPNPQSYSPGSLKSAIHALNGAYLRGRSSVLDKP